MVSKIELPTININIGCVLLAFEYFHRYAICVREQAFRSVCAVVKRPFTILVFLLQLRCGEPKLLVGSCASDAWAQHCELVQAIDEISYTFNADEIKSNCDRRL